MESLLNPETFEFFAKYLLAGYVILSTRSWLVTGERPKPNETIIEAVILSLLNQLIWRFGTSWIQVFFTPIPAELALAMEVVVQPIVIGLLVGWAVRTDWLPVGLRRLFMPITRPVTDAFDLALERATGGGFVIVTYEDGTVVYGYFGERSLASPDQERGGIFIESLYEVADGVWRESTPTRGAWISMHGVRSTEFILVERTNG